MSLRPSLRLLPLTLGLAATACGGDDAPSDQPDADVATTGVLGDWTITSIELEGTTYTRGDTDGVAGRMTFTSAAMHVELIKLTDGLPFGSIDELRFDLELDGDVLLATGGDATYAFVSALDGDQLTLTFDPDDPRTTDPDAPPTVELQRAGLPDRLSGDYRALTMTTTNGEIATGTCLELDPPQGGNAGVRYDVELDISDRLLLEVRQGATYYADAACTTTGTAASETATALIEDDGTDVTLYVEPHEGEDTGEIETFRVTDGASDTIVWTRVGCPACDGPQELVLEPR